MLSFVAYRLNKYLIIAEYDGRRPYCALTVAIGKARRALLADLTGSLMSYLNKHIAVPCGYCMHCMPPWSLEEMWLSTRGLCRWTFSPSSRSQLSFSSFQARRLHFHRSKLSFWRNDSFEIRRIRQTVHSLTCSRLCWRHPTNMRFCLRKRTWSFVARYLNIPELCVTPWYHNSHCCSHSLSVISTGWWLLLVFGDISGQPFATFQRCKDWVWVHFSAVAQSTASILNLVFIGDRFSFFGHDECRHRHGKSGTISDGIQELTN